MALWRIKHMTSFHDVLSSLLFCFAVPVCPKENNPEKNMARDRWLTVVFRCDLLDPKQIPYLFNGQWTLLKKSPVTASFLLLNPRSLRWPIVLAEDSRPVQRDSMKRGSGRRGSALTITIPGSTDQLLVTTTSRLDQRPPALISRSRTDNPALLTRLDLRCFNGERRWWGTAAGKGFVGWGRWVLLLLLLLLLVVVVFRVRFGFCMFSCLLLIMWGRSDWFLVVILSGSGWLGDA